MRAHDVRRAKVCPRCSQLGLPEQMFLVDDHHEHPKCFLSAAGASWPFELYKLPTKEIGKLTVGVASELELDFAKITGLLDRAHERDGTG